VAFIVNSGLGTPFGDLRTARISGAVLASIERLAATEPQDTSVPAPASAWTGRAWWRVLDALGVG